MNHRHIVLSFALTAFASSEANAQIGGLIKKKAQEAIKGPEKIDDKKKTGDASSPFNANVLEITTGTFEGTMRSLKVEVALQSEFKAELAKYPTRVEYNQCQAKVATSEANQKLLSILDLPENSSAAQRDAAMKKFAEEGTALLKKSCPLDPNTWNDSKKEARLTEIRAKAAAASGATGGSDDAQAFGVFFSSDQDHRTMPAIDAMQYAILLERIEKLCALRRSNALPKSGGAKVPGTGDKVFWLFTPGELSVVDDGNCKRFVDLHSQLMK